MSSKGAVQTSKHVGTLGYIPLDIDMQQEYSGKMVDNFAIGFLIFLMMTKRCPWS